ncbi:MAG TPA: ATP-dependent helicase, partial [Lamprocystis sp. (in: g-proteobacteria)]|nr:ATP-dependent helicase [Lamprocystis sp. (in: g-proteobacteria)]
TKRKGPSKGKAKPKVAAAPKPKEKVRERERKNIGKRRQPSAAGSIDAGFAPPRGKGPDAYLK